LESDPELCVCVWSAKKDCMANASHSISVLSDSIKNKSFYKNIETQNIAWNCTKLCSFIHCLWF
jgi:hypothetical protein